MVLLFLFLLNSWCNPTLLFFFFLFAKLQRVAAPASFRRFPKLGLEKWLYLLHCVRQLSRVWSREGYPQLSRFRRVSATHRKCRSFIGSVFGFMQLKIHLIQDIHGFGAFSMSASCFFSHRWYLFLYFCVSSSEANFDLFSGI